MHVFLQNQILLFRYQLRFASYYGVTVPIIKDTFGLTQKEAYLYLKKNKLGQRKPEVISECIKICRQLGFKDDQIFETPELFKSKPIVLEQHYMTLEEGGFQIITPYILCRYRTYYSKSIISLKEQDFINKETDVVKSFLSHFNPPLGVNDFNFNDEERWRDVHHKLLKMYIKWRLDATDEQVEVLFRVHKMIANKSIRLLCENIALCEDIGFSKRKIIKCGYLLHTYPKYTKEILKDIPNIAGADMKRAMFLYPKLFMTSPKNIIKIYGILKEFEISDESIRNQMNVFNMSPDTVRLRLNEIKRIPELQIFMKHKNILRLVVHHNRARSRLSYLQELQLKCTPLLILGSNMHEFDDHIKDGRDVNRPNELKVFLKNLLNRDPKIFYPILQKHPFYLQVPLVQMKETYDYLRTLKFHNEAICRVIFILLYSK